MTTSDSPLDDRTADDEGRSERPRPPRHAGQPRLPSVDDRPSVADLDRRTFLEALGAAGVAASLAGAGSGSAAAQSSDWEARADQRIQEHRTGPLEVVVEDASGNAVSGADVEVEMQQHDYGFGCAVHAEFLVNGTEWGDPIEGLTEEDRQRYRETLEENFNEIVLENLHKWNFWEDENNREYADQAVDWAVQQNDLDVRGHVCLWGNVEAWAVPPDVVEAMGVEWPDGPEEYEGPDRDPQLVRERSMAHLEEIIEYYGDDITEWDVVNEVFHQPAMIEAIEGDGVTPETAPILGDWYERAEEVASQYDVAIATNDYNTLNGPIGNARDRYETQLQYLVEERGVDLDGVGCQGHFRQRTGELSPEQVVEAVDRYSGYGAGVRCTEFDVFQGDWTDEGQAEYLHQFLKSFFSHPNTDDFLVWGHWTPLHWGEDRGGEEPNAPFYREDWSEKPALEAYRSLVFDEWWTSESGTTDDAGTYATDAFLGEHEVTVDGETTSQTVSVTDPSSTTRVVVGPGDGDDPGCSAPSVQVGGRTIQDPDGDGDYEDVDADCEASQTDVVEFFQVQHRSAWKRPEYVDFSGNGAVGHGDVVALFEEVTAGSL